ncbi:helix-turn-helix transcriptional regulator [Micromonospora sp. NPDC049114]|uniref:helix-turn-helix transcriptional regulator n=1 Tax=Micromonospora sp. NPDC049114 TaxID=3155498 RepID=UPI0033F7B2B6
MKDVSEQAVLRAVAAMHDRMGEQLTVDDMARAAMFSKFHFTRIFRRVTGVSPARFLSALRLQRAKDLLITTSMNVADISVRVGYNSVGTFSWRFSRSVGMSPTAFRRHAGYTQSIHPHFEWRSGRSPSGQVSCQVRLAEEHDHPLIFVGLFSGRIPEGRPARCAVLQQPGSVHFDAVPLGSWYLLAQAVSAGADGAEQRADVADRAVSVATYGPITVRADSKVTASMVLRRSSALDPPVLLALLDARKYALSQAQHGGTTAVRGRVGAAA